MTVHIIGAGLSGLAAAVLLSSKHGTPRRGLRSRGAGLAAAAGPTGTSELDRVIDNGNRHMMLSGNNNVRDYLRIVGAEGELVGPAGEGFQFLDLLHNRSFNLRPNNGPFPWWVAVPGRRVPGTGLSQYLAAAKLAFAPANASVAEILPHDELYRVLWEPLAVSALNTPIDQASAQGFWRVLVKTLARAASRNARAR